MKRKIWKYMISSHGTAVFESTEGAQFLSAMFDPKAILCVWMAVDPNAPKKRFTFHTVFTGEDAPDDSVFVATEVSARNDLVFHVFLGGQQ